MALRNRLISDTKHRAACQQQVSFLNYLVPITDGVVVFSVASVCLSASKFTANGDSTRHATFRVHREQLKVTSWYEFDKNPHRGTTLLFIIEGLLTH